jgi:hypothetical protein
MIPGRREYNLIGTEDDPIPMDEPVFILRAQDELGELVVRFYALLAEQLLHNPRLSASAKMQAELFASWPTRKRPDL